MKIKWKVSDVPTGRYSSFVSRSWPMAYYPEEKPAVMLWCKDEYVTSRVKTGNHSEIKIYIACWYVRSEDSQLTFTWKKMVKTAKTLKDAKKIAGDFIAKHHLILTAGGFK